MFKKLFHKELKHEKKLFCDECKKVVDVKKHCKAKLREAKIICPECVKRWTKTVRENIQRQLGIKEN